MLPWMEIYGTTDENGNTSFTVQAVKLEPRKRVSFSIYDGYGKHVFTKEISTNNKGVIQERIVIPDELKKEPGIIWAAQMQPGTKWAEEHIPKSGLIMTAGRDDQLPTGAEIRVSYI